MYLSDRIFPILPKAMRQGTQYYQDILTDVVAQTGRVAGTAPTTNLVADEKTTFNLENDEFIDREEIPDGDIAGLGGLDAAQHKAARKAKRAVGNAVEDLTAANVLANGSVTYTDIGTSLIRAIGLGKDTIMDREGAGRIALVISSRLFHLIKTYTEIKTAMAYTGVPITDLADVRGIRPSQVAAALDVDEILIGNNTQWYNQSATYQSRAALVALPDPNIEPDEVCQVGRTLWFSPSGLVPSEPQLYEVHTWFSETELSEMCDARAYAEQHLFNVEHIYGLAGVDGGPTS